MWKLLNVTLSLVLVTFLINQDSSAVNNYFGVSFVSVRSFS